VDLKSKVGGGTPTRQSVYEMAEVKKAEEGPSDMPNMLAAKVALFAPLGRRKSRPSSSSDWSAQARTSRTVEVFERFQHVLYILYLISKVSTHRGWRQSFLTA
jgi:hypothetical protein